jgi:hypothetical protein
MGKKISGVWVFFAFLIANRKRGGHRTGRGYWTGGSEQWVYVERFISGHWVRQNGCRGDLYLLVYPRQVVTSEFRLPPPFWYWIRSLFHRAMTILNDSRVQWIFFCVDLETRNSGRGVWRLSGMDLTVESEIYLTVRLHGWFIQVDVISFLDISRSRASVIPTLICLMWISICPCYCFERLLTRVFRLSRCCSGPCTGLGILAFRFSFEGVTISLPCRR